MLTDILCIVAGFILLVKGGDFLVDGSVAIARRARLSPMVIGLTVMGFGTSAPELLVSAQAAWRGSSGIALGNVAGSNIANIGLILGLTAMMGGLPVSKKTLRVDVPFMLLAMLALIGSAAYDGVIERWMGAAMVLMLTAFVWGEVWSERKKGNARANASHAGATAATHAGEATPPDAEAAGAASADMAGVMPLWKALGLVAVSLGAMVWGSNLLVDGASSVAMRLGDLFGADREAMERIVGLTVVAVGTSLPELFASVMAARKGETDMAVGNIIGSVSFNILCVVGVSTMIAPIANAWTPFAVDYAVMLGMSLLLWLFLRTGYRMGRWEGLTLLASYAVYVAWIIF